MYLLAGEVDVGAVLEYRRDLRQAVARDRAGVVESGETRERSLDREGDALFRLQRRVPGRFGIDLHLDVGDVGHRLDRTAAVVPDAQPRRAGSQEQATPAMRERCPHDYF